MPEKADTRQARAERQAKALRENLKRRKAQSRGRRADAVDAPEAVPAGNRKALSGNRKTGRGAAS